MEKIVIAEDNALYRSILAKTLSLNGYEIVGEAVDGFQALELVISKRPNLLILDLSLPKLDGITVIQKIRLKFQQVKILVLTIHEAPEYLEQAFTAGIDGYCLKDESLENITEAIEKILIGDSFISSDVEMKLAL